ncbi:hypothetical protein K1T71_003305 [Dendrolimus kikuchii]|uniref:Uncharacterized protein n=1 Tax=Dendrolimus kikuchii TaxID=765133 RepID=A0ACC1DBL4_9NEOP|nr:hypothetical protein K1T71_003305 [Dendrolimus kikuchii]
MKNISRKPKTDAITMSFLGRSNEKVPLSTSGIKKLQFGNNLLGYTVVTLLIVLAIYLSTKDWKGLIRPDEVDIGNFGVSTHACRRKHTHIHRH